MNENDELMSNSVVLNGHLHKKYKTHKNFNFHKLPNMHERNLHYN